MKQLYRKFCQKEKDIPIFSKDWWLDGVCGKDNWNVVLVEKGGQIMGALPYFTKKRWGLLRICMPELTQNMGVYIKYPSKQKYYKKLSWEKEIMSELIEKLPKFDSFSQSFHYSITNWLPFYWKNYEQRTYYTYVIEDISLDTLQEICETDTRRRRRRRATSAGVEVIEAEDIDKFYELNKMTFKRQEANIGYTLEFIKNLYEICKKNDCVKMYFAKYQEKIIAANFLVYDNNSVYYLMGGIDPEYKNLGAMDVVQFESIKFALNNNKTFDFEGSIMESIEKYFRSFGAIQKPYFHISKTNSNIIKSVQFIKSLNDKN